MGEELVEDEGAQQPSEELVEDGGAQSPLGLRRKCISTEKLGEAVSPCTNRRIRFHNLLCLSCSSVCRLCTRAAVGHRSPPTFYICMSRQTFSHVLATDVEVGCRSLCPMLL